MKYYYKNHSTILKQRRIKYQIKKLKPNQQAIEDYVALVASYRLGKYDQMGHDYEIKEVLVELEEAGLGEYITYHNSEDEYLWSCAKAKGVDFKLKVGDYELYVEASFCSKPYKYRKRWFMKCRFPRFKDCPKPAEKILWIVLTNRPENFSPPSVQAVAKEHSIQIMAIPQLIYLLNKLKQPVFYYRIFYIILLSYY